MCLPAQGGMEKCLAAAALNGVDRRSLQRSARLGQEVLERAKRRAVDWHSLELPKGSVRVISRERRYQETRPAAGPQRLLPGEREERHPTLNASFRTMAEFMDYTSSQCGIDSEHGTVLQDCVVKGDEREPEFDIGANKYYSSVPEEGGATHVYRYHRGKLEPHLCSDIGNSQVCIFSCPGRCPQPLKMGAPAGSVLLDVCVAQHHTVLNRNRKDTFLGLGGTCQVSECTLEASQPVSTELPVYWASLPVRFHEPGALVTIGFFAQDISKDLYIEVYPGTYSVTVGTNDLTKKTHVVAVDSGQSVDLVFSV
ncbi:hypothetical protein MC885_013603 [Smutsia gigantea]|nr:hypothetical protein MC885_013603 [Smutsia gigantea]